MPSAFVLSLPGFGFSVGGRADRHQVTGLVRGHLPILMAGQ
jgi:hypothetical protein